MTHGQHHHYLVKPNWEAQIFKMDNGTYVALVTIPTLKNKIASKEANSPEQADEFAYFIAEEMINMGVI